MGRFQQRDSVQIPSAQYVPQSARLARPLPALTEGQFVGPRQQEAVPPRANHVAAICTDVEAVFIGKPVAGLTLERCRCIPLGIAYIVRQCVIGLVSQTAESSLRNLRFQSLVSLMAVVLR